MGFDTDGKRVGRKMWAAESDRPSPFIPVLQG